MPPPGTVCQTCKFYTAPGPASGICVRYPPTFPAWPVTSPPYLTVSKNQAACPEYRAA